MDKLERRVGSGALAGVALALLAPASARATPPEEIAYQAIPKTIYAWNPGPSSSWWAWSENGNDDRFVAFCRTHGFRRATVFVGSVAGDWAASYSLGMLPHQAELASFTAKLRLAGIAPVALFYLNDDPNDLTNFVQAADVVTAPSPLSERSTVVTDPPAEVAHRQTAIVIGAPERRRRWAGHQAALRRGPTQAASWTRRGAQRPGASRTRSCSPRATPGPSGWRPTCAPSRNGCAPQWRRSDV